MMIYKRILLEANKIMGTARPYVYTPEALKKHVGEKINFYDAATGTTTENADIKYDEKGQYLYIELDIKDNAENTSDTDSR